MFMPEPKTTVLYARVSREEQVRGYSLAQQLEVLREHEALREHCVREDHEIVEEVEDLAESSATLVRPGLDRARDLPEEGAAVLVLAQDADRITREPMHRFASFSMRKPGGVGHVGWSRTTGVTTPARASS